MLKILATLSPYSDHITIYWDIGKWDSQRFENMKKLAKFGATFRNILIKVVTDDGREKMWEGRESGTRTFYIYLCTS